jgi:hypothetical protein
MKLALALAALVVAVPSSPLACEAPGPCSAFDPCDGAECDAPAVPVPAAPPSMRCDAPGCESPVQAACEGPGCDAPDAKPAVEPALQRK